ncbi:hypothetical protein V8F20_003916 [Naviculisporaceae sp. PSN 640]
MDSTSPASRDMPIRRARRAIPIDSGTATGTDAGTSIGSDTALGTGTVDGDENGDRNGNGSATGNSNGNGRVLDPATMTQVFHFTPTSYGQPLYGPAAPFYLMEWQVLPDRTNPPPFDPGRWHTPEHVEAFYEDYYRRTTSTNDNGDVTQAAVRTYANRVGAPILSMINGRRTVRQRFRITVIKIKMRTRLALSVAHQPQCIPPTRNTNADGAGYCVCDGTPIQRARVDTKIKIREHYIILDEAGNGELIPPPNGA